MSIHRVWLATEMGDVVEAIDQAERVGVTALPGHLSERCASHLITVGWAQLPAPRRRGTCRARRCSGGRPEQLLFTKRVRSKLNQMLRRGRRALREMAGLVGVG